VEIGLIVVPFQKFVRQSVNLPAGAGEAPARQILELCALPRNEQAWRGIVEAGALKLPDRAGEFADLRAQFQNPERYGIVSHMGPAPRAAPAFRCRE
jgi:hypothetical protein